MGIDGKVFFVFLLISFQFPRASGSKLQQKESLPLRSNLARSAHLRKYY